jgi:hypothetical protein
MMVNEDGAGLWVPHAFLAKYPSIPTAENVNKFARECAFFRGVADHPYVLMSFVDISAE